MFCFQTEPVLGQTNVWIYWIDGLGCVEHTPAVRFHINDRANHTNAGPPHASFKERSTSWLCCKPASTLGGLLCRQFVFGQPCYAKAKAISCMPSLLFFLRASIFAPTTAASLWCGLRTTGWSFSFLPFPQREVQPNTASLMLQC